jgi:uncharacterized protein involved in outer membrane biogenesis
MKRIAIAIIALIAAAGVGVALLARNVLTGENVRAAVAAQVSAAVGQPVTIGALDASIYPRVTMNLADVAIGSNSAIHLDSVQMGVALGALLSRRIENAAVRVDGARITLPLPAFAIGANTDPSATAQDSSLPVEIVSIDEIVLRDVEVIRGDRRLRGDIELVPRNAGVELRRLGLAIEDTRVDATGTLVSLAPLEGRIEATANAVDFDRLLAFLRDFADIGGASAPARGANRESVGKLIIELTLAQATSGALSLSDVRTTAVVTPDDVALDPVGFGIFDGRYEGSMQTTLGDRPHYRWRGKVSGAPNSISGRLAGTVTLDGSGLDVESALRSVRGEARIDITDGAIAGLALVRTIVLATSGRGGYVASAGRAIESRGDASEAERFSRLGVTLSLADGLVTTRDFSMTSTDTDLTGAGTIRLADMTTRLDGQVRLSEALSAKAGTDLYRYAQEGGRVTLPTSVSGPINGLAVRIDVGEAAKRALRNRATEEAQKVIERNLKGGLKGLFPRRPPS